MENCPTLNSLCALKAHEAGVHWKGKRRKVTRGSFNQGLVREAVSSQISWNGEFIIRTRPYIIDDVTGEVK